MLKSDLVKFNNELWITSGSVLLKFCVLFVVLQLVSNAIQFLASVCERPHYKHLFEDQNTLTSICEKVIVPNMEFRGNVLRVKFWKTQ